MKRNYITIDTAEEKKVRAELEKRTDFEAARERRFLALPDLSRVPGHPLAEMINRTLDVPTLKEFDVIQVPELVSAKVTFDLFNMPAGHPARSKSDTYYATDEYILRTHTTVMWYYYLQQPEIQAKIKNREPIGVLCHGKVYRKDEIDNRHMNIFHQLDGLYLVPDEKQTLSLDDLKATLTEVAQTVFGKDVKHRFNPDTFPYTDPSLEMEIEKDGKWLEMLGGGMARQSVLSNLGLTGYNGWAFGFGLERLAMVSMSLPDIRLLWSNDERVVKQLVLGNKFKEVSKYPAIVRDISFIVPKTFVPNNYFDLIRDAGGDDIIEEVSLLDKYENDKKFGADKMSYTYRIVYRSLERTLTNEEIEPLQNKIIDETKKQFNAEIR